MRTVESICESNKLVFQIILRGNRYCSISLNDKPIECKYYGEKDHNNLHTCNYFEIKQKELNTDKLQ